MNQKEIDKLTKTLNSAEPMPVLFIGHDSPMNAIEDNEFSKGWRQVTEILPKPKAILCISAHWETRGTLVTAMESHVLFMILGAFQKSCTKFSILLPECLSWQKRLKV